MNAACTRRCWCKADGSRQFDGTQSGKRGISVADVGEGTEGEPSRQGERDEDWETRTEQEKRSSAPESP